MNRKISPKAKIGIRNHFCQDHLGKNALTLEQVLHYIQDNGLRITKPRINILKTLLNGDHFHTIQSIIWQVKKMDKNTNVSSVYNNLEVLSKTGVIKPVIDMLTNQPAYEIALETAPHIHVFDFEEKNQISLNIDCQIHKALVESLQEKGYELEDYLIQATVRKIKKP